MGLMGSLMAKLDMSVRRNGHFLKAIMVYDVMNVYAVLLIEQV